MRPIIFIDFVSNSNSLYIVDVCNKIKSHLYTKEYTTGISFRCVTTVNRFLMKQKTHFAFFYESNQGFGLSYSYFY